jgi:hypothetical protein
VTEKGDDSPVKWALGTVQSCDRSVMASIELFGAQASLPSHPSSRVFGPEPGSVKTMFRNVQLKVKQAIGQDPWLSFPTLPAVYFAGTKLAALTPEQQVELTYWLSVKDSTSPEVLTAYLKRYPDGQFAEIARTLAEHYERKLKAEQAAQEESANALRRRGKSQR